jgi:signal transduction histidine kinase
MEAHAMDLAHELNSAPIAQLQQAAAALEALCRSEHKHEHERVQRADAIGELGIAIAHEINQPLAAIALHAAAAHKWLQRSEPDIERALASLSQILNAGRQAGDIVRSVHRLAARQDSECGDVEVDRVLADALQWPRHLMRGQRIAFDFAPGLPGCVIRASRVQLQQVLTNLLLNAIEALAGSSADSSSGRIGVSSRRYNEHDIEIVVADNGPGIAPADRERVFGRLFSTKRNGTGMGLSISRAIARAHGGDLVFEPCAPQGACFRLRLPLRAPGMAAMN